MSWENLQRDILEDFADVSRGERERYRGILESRRQSYLTYVAEYYRQPHVRARVNAQRRRSRRELWPLRAALRLPDLPPLPVEVVGRCRLCGGVLEVRYGCRSAGCADCGARACAGGFGNLAKIPIGKETNR